MSVIRSLTYASCFLRRRRLTPPLYSLTPCLTLHRSRDRRYRRRAYAASDPSRRVHRGHDHLRDPRVGERREGAVCPGSAAIHPHAPVPNPSRLSLTVQPELPERLAEGALQLLG